MVHLRVPRTIEEGDAPMAGSQFQELADSRVAVQFLPVFPAEILEALLHVPEFLPQLR